MATEISQVPRSQYTNYIRITKSMQLLFYALIIGRVKVSNNTIFITLYVNNYIFCIIMVP